MVKINNRRVASLEVLRVLSMFLVVVSHYFYHGLKVRPELQDYYSLNSLAGGCIFISLEALYIMSCVAVNCFVMISGFFLIEKTNYRWKGILNVWIETFFYSVLFLIVTFFIRDSISLSDVFHSVFPILGRKYWFVTYYLGLMLLAPIISRAMISLSANQYRIILIFLFVMNFQYLYGGIYGGFNSLMWFTFLFIVGGYFKRFGCPMWIKRNKGILLLSVWNGLLLMALAFNLRNSGSATLVSTSYHGPVFFLSVCVFVYFAFTQLKGKWVDIICMITPYTFAVYLIHANGFWGSMLWDMLIPDSFNISIVFYCLIGCFTVFFTCIVIDVLRSMLFDIVHIPQLISLVSTKLPQL